MGPIGCPETSVTHYQSTLRKIPEECRREVLMEICVGTGTLGESNGKLPPRTCPGCSVPEPYRSHDWALVPASPASKAEY